MPKAKCNIDGNVYQLDYEKTSSSAGSLFHGVLHGKEELKFSFLVSDNPLKPNYFEPNNTNDYTQNAIKIAIHNDEIDSAKEYYFPTNL